MVEVEAKGERELLAVQWKHLEHFFFYYLRIASKPLTPRYVSAPIKARINLVVAVNPHYTARASNP